MKHSTDRILTTHVGSLPRPPELIAMVRAKLRGEAVDPQAHAKVLKDSVAGIVRKQVELGIDVIDDGEFGKPSFVSYGNERLGGFSPRRDGGGVSPWAQSREALAFPEFYKTQMGSVSSQHARLVCTGPVTYMGQAALKTDLDNLKAALNGVSPAEVFVPSISPASFEDWNKNEYYNSDEDYVAALGEAMRTEYQAIIDAGFLLQIDDPRLVTYYILYPDKSIADCRKWAELRVEALNHALRGIPTEKIRYHTCYGINMGPRVHDMELKDIIDIILKIRAGAYSFEASNPRHEHEWTVWQRRQAARRHDPHPRRDLAFDRAGRASRADRAAAGALRGHRRARERHRRHRLRLCDIRGRGRNPPQHRVGQVRGAGAGCENREPGVVGVALSRFTSPRLRGEVGARSEPGEGDSRSRTSPSPGSVLRTSPPSPRFAGRG